MLRDILSVLIVVLSAFFAGYVQIVEWNTDRNSALELEEGFDGDILLCDQKGKTGQKFRYGLYPLKHNGCELLAYHNARLLKGRPRALWEDIRHVQSVGGMFGYGLFGTMPHAIGRALKKDHIPFTRVGSTQLNVPGVYIVSFWNAGKPLGGLHTVAAKCDGKLMTLYNDRGVSTVHADTAFGDDFISAYYLGKRNNVPNKIRR